MDIKTENIKFSIIMPVYNSEKYLSECIKSILRQTYNNFELIIIDDGSTDNSSHICDEFAILDSRIKVYHKKNEGVSAARNDGLKYVSGDYLMFVDSDDLVSNNCLYVYYKYIKSYNGYIYFQNYIFIKDNQSISLNLNTYEPCFCTFIDENSFSFFRNKWVLFSATWSKCYKFSIIRDYKIRFNPEISMCEDFLFMTEYLSFVDKIFYISNVGYQYRLVENSLSRNKYNNDYCHIDKILNNNLFKSPSGFVLESLKLFINMVINTRSYSYLDRKVRYKIINLYKRHKVKIAGKKFFLTVLTRKLPLCVNDIYFLVVKRCIG